MKTKKWKLSTTAGVAALSIALGAGATQARLAPTVDEIETLEYETRAMMGGPPASVTMHIDRTSGEVQIAVLQSGTLIGMREGTRKGEGASGEVAEGHVGRSSADTPVWRERGGDASLQQRQMRTRSGRAGEPDREGSRARRRDGRLPKRRSGGPGMPGQHLQGGAWIRTPPNRDGSKLRVDATGAGKPPDSGTVACARCAWTLRD